MSQFIKCFKTSLNIKSQNVKSKKDEKHKNVNKPKIQY